MMPAYCPDSAPPGEKSLFETLAAAPGSNSWVVLHSLGISDHVRQVEGEADFVVIIPKRGVLVIEVKSHRSIDRLPDGRWKLGNDAPTARGPFQQASEAMYSIRNYMVKRGVELRSMPVLDAVWFTSVRARTMLPASPEWHPWQVLDSEDLRADATAAILRTLAAGAAHLDTKIHGFGRDGLGPDVAAADRIAAILRPRFELVTMPGDRRRSRNIQLTSFIDEQYGALDAMQDNRAVLFGGPAGCGKTLLAQEAVRREVAMGHSGQLLCYNRLLGRRLRDEMADIPGVRVGTLHQEFLRIAGISPPVVAGPGFWEQELPDRAMEVLLAGGKPPHEFLIVDEVQDIASEQYLDVLDLLTDGGLSEGRVLLFGDFERQAIFDVSDGRALLRSRVPHLTEYALTSNCRNLPRIGYLVNKFSGLDPGYRRFRRQDDGIDPTFVTFAVGGDQSDLLAEAIRQLRDDGFDLNEIAVLSPLRSGATAEETKDPWLRQILRPSDGHRSRPGQLNFCTVQAFKGLEAPAIVITDLDRQSVPNFESILYVGLTRATDRLVALIESETLRSALGGNP